jgi:hypothetical protein
VPYEFRHQNPTAAAAILNQNATISDDFGNPVDAGPKEHVAEVQGDPEKGKTFLWPKIVNEQ